jgi:hypothetical protein
VLRACHHAERRSTAVLQEQPAAFVARLRSGVARVALLQHSTRLRRPLPASMPARAAFTRTSADHAADTSATCEAVSLSGVVLSSSGDTWLSRSSASMRWASSRAVRSLEALNAASCAAHRCQHAPLLSPVTCLAREPGESWCQQGVQRCCYCHLSPVTCPAVLPVPPALPADHSLRAALRRRRCCVCRAVRNVRAQLRTELVSTGTHAPIGRRRCIRRCSSLSMDSTRWRRTPCGRRSTATASSCITRASRVRRGMRNTARAPHGSHPGHALCT